MSKRLQTDDKKRIALIGMMGSGKSEVGKTIANWLGWDFFDTDELIEKRLGMSIKKIFEKFGENYFRKVESEILIEVLKNENCIISTGGGMILSEENRKMLLERAKTYFLDTSLKTLRNRIDASNRPLLLGKDLSKRLQEIWQQREKFYRMFETVNTNNLNVREVSMKVLLRFFEERGSISEVYEGVHKLTFGIGKFREYLEELKNKNEEIFLFISDRVNKILGEYFKDFDYLVLEDGEKVKEFDNLKSMYEFLIERNASRDSMIVGIGGGTITDTVGFVASTFKRGCKVSFIPTTLLAQVDAAIGGKNGVNFGQIKNMVGTFKMPENVYIDSIIPLSMDAGRFEEGLIEALKMAIIMGNKFELFENVEKDEIRRVDFIYDLVKFSATAKLGIVEKDPNDRNLRRFLNLGHTFGHALESYYSLTHGQAVAIGMLEEAKLGENLGITDENFKGKLIKVLSNIISVPELKITKEVFKKIMNDKKNKKDIINIVIPKDVGKIEIRSFKFDELRKIIDIN